MKALAVILATLLFVLVSCSPPDEECKVEKMLSNDDTEIGIE
jgi:hypothetical protein